MLQTARRSFGFSLVEVLVALVVLSVGMLGIAALYVESLRSTRTALIRSQAVILAADMGERIRANRDAGAAYTKAVDSEGTFNGACNQGGAGCTPAQMAAHDIAIWYDMLDSRAGTPTSLPGGRCSIAVADVMPAIPSVIPGEPAILPPLRRYTITIWWDETGQQAQSSYVFILEV